MKITDEDEELYQQSKAFIASLQEKLRNIQNQLIHLKKKEKNGVRKFRIQLLKKLIM